MVYLCVFHRLISIEIDHQSTACCSLQYWPIFIFHFVLRHWAFFQRDWGYFCELYYSRYNKEYSELVESMLFWFVTGAGVIRVNKNHINIFLQFSDLKKNRFKEKKVANVYKSITLLPTIFVIYRIISTPSILYVHEQCRRPKNVYKRSTL